jgi:uncharacterized protein (UPF0335 family)
MALAANSLEGKSENYLRRIENLLDDLDSKRGSYMAECKEVREDIKEIYVEAKDNGVPVKALKGLVRFRQLEKKQRAISAGLDIDEGAAYDTLVEQLGELGMAAAKRAGHAPKQNGAGDDDDSRDLRPRHLQEKEKTRAVDGGNLRNTNPDDLNKVGRGPVEQQA